MQPPSRSFSNIPGPKHFSSTANGATIAKQALSALKSPPLVVDIDDIYAEGGERIGACDYEEFLGRGDAGDEIEWPADEFDAITLNYTSGTTGNPKGALYHHRGCYLNTLGQIIHHQLTSDFVYLWTLPMFHVNGWCFAWGMAAIGGTHVCLRKVLPGEIFDSIEANGVTHMCGAPTVLGMLIEGAAKTGITLKRPVAIMTAGAAPPAPILKATEELGFVVRHVYGMTEMHGVVALCDWHREWDSLAPEQRSKLMARQGVRSVVTDDMIVADPMTLEPLPRDGTTIGEIMFRGNNGMKGYLRTRRRLTKLSPAAGTGRAIWPSPIPTATSRSRTAPRTSSSPAARTSPPSRSRRFCSSIPRCPTPPRSP